MGAWLQAAGAGIGIAGDLEKGKIDAATGETNRRLAVAQANDALLRGSIEEQRYRREIAQVIGSQKAALGERNVAMSGTALDILSDTAQVGEEDALTIRNNASREAWGYRNQANEASRWSANARSDAYGRVGGSLLTSGAQAYGAWAENRDRIAPVKVSAKRVGG
jgi:hypothetical protein